jgi:hypothetical protein
VQRVDAGQDEPEHRGERCRRDATAGRGVAVGRGVVTRLADTSALSAAAKRVVAPPANVSWAGR